MNRTTRWLIPVLGAGALALSACSTTTPGSAQPSQAGETGGKPPSGAIDDVPGPGVPKVAAPIDFTNYLTKPCESLHSNQVDELLGENATPKPDLKAGAGPTCVWRKGSSQAAVTVNFLTLVPIGATKPMGLTGYYNNREKDFKFFEVLPSIDGYPAIAYGVKDERKTEGVCTVATGTSDRYAFNVAINLSPGNIATKDPCEYAKKVAGEVLANIKGGH
ncbi:DUF3558 domain-containing protein [Amycolatopsis samaneae]|uniref:DUF3558 domain-containing protein n=1 Tax=Amycolatopsis samaneae TaxID=664691 RepID=A0ABW5GG61_9PSEU